MEKFGHNAYEYRLLFAVLCAIFINVGIGILACRFLQGFVEMSALLPGKHPDAFYKYLFLTGNRYFFAFQVLYGMELGSAVSER